MTNSSYGIFAKHLVAAALDRNWDAKTNILSEHQRRQADLYVFCVLARTDETTLDPLNLAQWKFYVISAATLDREVKGQKTIGLTALEKMGATPINYEGLAKEVERIAALIH